MKKLIHIFNKAGEHDYVAKITSDPQSGTTITLYYSKAAHWTEKVRANLFGTLTVDRDLHFAIKLKQASQSGPYCDQSVIALMYRLYAELVDYSFADYKLVEVPIVNTPRQLLRHLVQQAKGKDGKFHITIEPEMFDRMSEASKKKAL